MAEREPHSRSIPEPDIGLAERLFDILRRETSDTQGVVRAAYGDGEQFAHDLVTAEARKVRLETWVDAAGNLYIKLPGSAAQPRTIIIGSHLVPSLWRQLRWRSGRAGRARRDRFVPKGRLSARRQSCCDGDPGRGEQLVSSFVYRVRKRRLVFWQPPHSMCVAPTRGAPWPST